MAISDILLIAVILLTFSYFHHVRSMWGIGKGDEVLGNFGSTGSSSLSDKLTESEAGQQHLSHNWQVKFQQKATCTENGYTIYVCSCGEETRADDLPALGHRNFRLLNRKDAADMESGYTGDKYCGVCGELVEKGTEIPALEHTNVELVGIKEATCKEEGYSGDWYCRDCRKIVAYGSATPKKEHTFEGGTVVPPDCQKEGYTVYRCTACGEEKIADRTSKTDHTPDKTGRCIVCGQMVFDTSGDFGKAFPEMFLQDKSIVNLQNDGEIRKYAAEQKLSLYDESESTYLALYRSHDIYMTVREVNTKVYRPAAKKYYAARYYDYDIYVRNIENLFTQAGSSASLETYVKKAEDFSGNPVIGAVNGDYMGNKNHCLLSVRNGELLRQTNRIESDICVLFYDGTMETFTPQTYDWAYISEKRPYQIWNFGPGLLEPNGDLRTSFDGNAYDDSVLRDMHPRTAMGCYAPGHYALVVVDGRKTIEIDGQQTKLYGMYIEQLALLMKEMGCISAYNMDGGDSSQAYLKGEQIRSANRDEQRRLTDIICVGERS